MSTDLDRKILGVLIDKIFGIIYGIVFSYFIFSTMMFTLNKFNLNNLNFWLINNSEILSNINTINEEYIFKFFPYPEIENL